MSKGAKTHENTDRDGQKQSPQRHPVVFPLRVSCMKKFLESLQEYSIPLIIGIAAALIWANMSPETYENFIHLPLFGDVTIHFVVEDVFMAFFFAIAMVEIVESFQPGGSLNPIKRAVNPLIATVGGVVGPVCVYLLLNAFIGAPEYANGWGIPTATDIAIAWLAAKLVFGGGHPAVNYLLLLAIVDDALGLIIIAIFYPTSTVMPVYLLFCLAGMIIAFFLRRWGRKNYWWYLLLGGIPCWYGLHAAHVHAALAFVFIVPFLPAAPKDVTEIDDADDEWALERFHRQWKPVVDFGMLFFGLCNAGVVFSAIGIPTALVLVALIFGKCFGVFCFGYLALKLGFELPKEMRKRDLAIVGLISGVGLTVALFICNSAFADPALQGAVKMGALFSIFSIPIAMAAARLLGIQKYREGR